LLPRASQIVRYSATPVAHSASVQANQAGGFAEKYSKGLQILGYWSQMRGYRLAIVSGKLRLPCESRLAKSHADVDQLSA
jgi:hypothetical protein